MAKVANLLSAVSERRGGNDAMAIMLAAQSSMATALVKGVEGEIAGQLEKVLGDRLHGVQKEDEQAVFSALETALQAFVVRQMAAGEEAVVSTLKTALRGYIRERVEAIQIPVPEVVERVVERVVESGAADREPQPVTVQRKDGIIDTVRVGDVTYDVKRNKQGLIKEVRPRA